MFKKLTGTNPIFGLKQVFVPMNKYERWRKQAIVMKLSKQARTRLEWIIYEEIKGNVLATCRHFDIAPKVFYTWKNRFDDKDLRLLESRITTPTNKRKKMITSIEESRIVELRRQHIRWGKMKIQKLYSNLYGQSISSWKIQYTIQKYKLYYLPLKNEKMQQKRKRNQSKKRITELKKQPFPGYLIALDTIVIYCNNCKRYILTAIDTVSKIAFARMYTSKSSKNASDFLKRIFYLLDGSVLNTLNDNGSEFHKEFITACKDLKIDQYWSRVHTPTDNPMEERFNRTLKEEFIALGNFNPDPVQFNQKLTEWLVEYTFVRPHQSLGYDTPWQFYEKTAKVLPRYSSRTYS
jgi:transposase InsO family protein